MALILKAISYKGKPPEQEISAQFDEQGGSIGRAPDNNLVLPDPEKFVSRLHATIVFEDGQYFIQDSSVGGTYLELKGMLLQQNQTPLMAGEVLRIGEYELVTTSVENSLFNFPPPAEPVRQLELRESSLFDGLGASAKNSAPPADFLSSFIDQPEASPFHESFTPPKIVSAPAAASAKDDLDFEDLLSGLDLLFGSESPKNSDLPILPDDFFAEEGNGANNPHQTETTSSAGKDLSVEAISVAGSIDAGLSLESAPLQPRESGLFDSENIEERQLVSTSTELNAGNGSLVNVEVAMAPEIVKEPPTLSGQHTATVTDSELMREFLSGAGINDSGFLSNEQWPVLMKTSGELLRSMVEGLMQVLRARAELKSQFRVSATTMRSIDNNPLKFTPNVDDAIKLILSPTNPGFLSPKQAVNEGFSDIMNHQIAMTSGIQAALTVILRSFDPELIEKSQGEGLLFHKKAKCWEQYTGKYPQLKEIAQENFFGDAFADAYEKQMLLLNRSTQNQ